MFVHRPTTHLTPNILSIPQLMVKALSAPRARPTDKLKMKWMSRSFQLRAPGEGRHTDGHGGQGARRAQVVPSGASVAHWQVPSKLRLLNRSPAHTGQHPCYSPVTGCRAVIKGQLSTGGRLGRSKGGNGFPPPSPARKH